MICLIRLIFEVDIIIIIIINWWHILQFSDNHIDVQQFDLQFISHSYRVTLVLSFHHMWNEFKYSIKNSLFDVKHLVKPACN